MMNDRDSMGRSYKKGIHLTPKKVGLISSVCVILLAIMGGAYGYCYHTSSRPKLVVVDGVTVVDKGLPPTRSYAIASMVGLGVFGVATTLLARKWRVVSRVGKWFNKKLQVDPSNKGGLNEGKTLSDLPSELLKSLRQQHKLQRQKMSVPSSNLVAKPIFKEAVQSPRPCPLPIYPHRLNRNGLEELTNVPPGMLSRKHVPLSNVVAKPKVAPQSTKVTKTSRSSSKDVVNPESTGGTGVHHPKEKQPVSTPDMQRKVPKLRTPSNMKNKP